MKILEQWETKHQKKIYKGYHYHIQVFLNTVNFEITKATYRDIVSYLRLLRISGTSVYVLKNRLSAIKFYYRCLVDFGYIQVHPCQDLVLKDKVNKTIVTALLYTAKELDSFLERTIGQSKHLQLRNKIIQQILVYQGLTTSELVQLKVTDIDLEKCTITIAKSRLNARVLELNAKQLLPLHNYISVTRIVLLNQQQSAFLLLSKTGKKIPSETLNGMLNSNFDKKFIPKRTRQSVIYHLLRKGNTLAQVQYFAGYKDITTVEQYKNSDIEALKQQILKNHPLNLNALTK